MIFQLADKITQPHNLKNRMRDSLNFKTAGLLFSLLILCFGTFSQSGINYDIHFKKGTIQFEENINTFKFSSLESSLFEGDYYAFMQFYQIPGRAERSNLESMGIQLQEYIPNNVYLVSIPMELNRNNLMDFNIRSITALELEDKVDQRLLERPFPNWVWHGDEIRVIAQYCSNLDMATIESELENANLSLVSEMHHVNMVILQIDADDIEEIAMLPFLRHLDFESQPGKAESDDGRNLHRSNMIHSDYHSGLQYDGTGVSAAINDDGFVGPHIDFKGREEQSDVINDMTGTHGDMTVGIVGSAGNLDPNMRGMAPAAFLWVRQYNQNMPNTETLHQTENVMVFSTSYSNGCNAGYTSTTALVDEEIYDNPSLMQVFSAGNSNNNDCNYGAGNQWGNITGGHKMGKNVMATANLYSDDLLASSSSRGPASDGRIKPDIAAHGQGQWSNSPNYSYAEGGGTSAAAPGIAGVFTQLHHAYRDLNNGADAPSALLKASIMNTAYDLGNPGPDFKFGWGKINAHKAYQTFALNHYFTDTISNAGIDIHELFIPNGVQEARIMVYWHDVEASSSSTFALVNNLDMKITDLASDIHLPLILDHTPNAITLDNNAVPGVDSINNVEQVRLANPSSGNHQIKIYGTTVAQGPVEYFIVYEFLYNNITVTYPNGGEGLVPGSSDRIHWDAYGDAGIFTLEYTLDSGTTWTTIVDSLSGDSRFFDYQLPNTVSKAKIRISRGLVSDESDEFFSIIQIPENISVTAICSATSSIKLTWDSVPQAVAYDVFHLGTMFMDSAVTSTSLIAEVNVPNVADENWFSVRARGPNGEVGERAIAVLADGSGCMLDCVSENDAGVEELISPAKFLESCTGNTHDVSVELVNIGPNTQTGFQISYQFNASATVTETYTGSLTGGGSQTYTFSTQVSFTNSGIHTLKIWTNLLNDGANCNDTLFEEIQYYDPLAVFPYVEDFSGSFPPLQINIINADGSITWNDAIVNGANGLPTKCAMINNYAYNSVGSEDIIETILFDLTSSPSAELKFDVAHAPYSSSYTDGLRVDISSDCGLTYTQAYFKEGSTLGTVSYNTSEWSPGSSNDWREETVDLSIFIGSNIKVQFVSITGYGNNLYLDNINIESVNQAPSSNFEADVLNSCDGIIQFSDLSINSPQSWLWQFGDGGTSNDQNPLYNYTSEGTFDITLITSNPLGSDTVMIPGYITIDFPDAPVVDDAIACFGNPLEMIATGALDEIRWYEGNILMHTNDTIMTPQISADLLYQVENVVLEPSQYVGPQDNSIGAGGIHSSSFTGTINFIAERELYILSAWVEVQTAGDRTFTIWDDINGSGNMVSEVVVNIPAGTGRIDLNLHVPSAGTYSLGGSNVNMYRNSSGAIYPYILPDMITLTGSSANSGGNYYYYLYDLEVQKSPCTSPPVDVLVRYVEPAFNYSLNTSIVSLTDNSVGATSWSWDFGDGQTSTDQNPVVEYTATGNYTITLTVDGACSFSQDVQIQQLGNPELNNKEIVTIAPNPSSGKTTLLFDHGLNNATIQILSVDGKILRTIRFEDQIEILELDLSGWSPAMYYVKVQGSEKISLKKLILQ
jgi:PKD repeat protein